VLGTRWIDDKAMAKHLRGGEKYRVVAPNGNTSEATGSAPTVSVGICTDTLEIDLTPEPGKADSWLAIGGKSDLAPRHRVLSASVREPGTAAGAP
jgi:hypothetical protein